MNYFVTAIGTDSGKTLFSAMLAEALKGEYWKPVQAGYPTDTETITKLTAGSVYCHNERYVLNTPASPHFAASVDGVEIVPDDLALPQTQNHLVIEGAGGALVPINDDDFVIDLVPRFNASILLVSNLYLGSINHTMLTLELIKQRGYPLTGIIFNGPANKASEDIILKHHNVPCLLRIPELETVNYAVIKQYAEILKSNLDELGNKG